MHILILLFLQKMQLGIASLDINTCLKVSEFPNLNNTNTFYVYQKYSKCNSDCSIVRPYTTISSVLNLDTEPIDNTDIHLMDRFIIYINGGNYDEDLVG